MNILYVATEILLGFLLVAIAIATVVIGERGDTIRARHTRRVARVVAHESPVADDHDHDHNHSCRSAYPSA